jgi:hypothetical protein
MAEWLAAARRQDDSALRRGVVMERRSEGFAAGVRPEWGVTARAGWTGSSIDQCRGEP